MTQADVPSTKRIVIALILFFPLGVYWLIRRIGGPSAGDSNRALAIIIALVVGIVAIVAIASSGSSKKAPSKSVQPQPQTVATKPKPKPAAKKAQFVLVPRQSSCQENPGQAYVNCSIGVRNTGSSKGLPVVYVLYRYSDSGESYESSQDAIDQGGTPSDPIPAHSLGFVYFSHSYNAQQHNLIQAAASLDANAKGMPYIRVANPNDINWPNG